MGRYAISPYFFIENNKFIRRFPNEPLNALKEFKYNLDTKILIYEDRVKGWFLEIGEQLKKDNEAGFVILMIAISYLEGHQQYIEGEESENKSKEFFSEALKRIFSIDNNKISTFIYKNARCGLFHRGITKKGISINGELSKEIEIISEDTVIINPHSFLDKIKEDFKDYIIRLKDPSQTDMRVKFEKFWDFCNQ